MMRGIKIALPGINALTNTDPKNFSLYVDGSEDHILVKEKTRGSQSVNAYTTLTVAHSLSYAPHAMAMVGIGSDYQWIYGLNAYSVYRMWIDTTNVYIRNGDSSAHTIAYLIFYDNL